MTEKMSAAGRLRSHAAATSALVCAVSYAVNGHAVAQKVSAG